MLWFVASHWKSRTYKALCCVVYVALCYGCRIVDGTAESANELKLLLKTVNQLVEIQILVEKKSIFRWGEYFFWRGTTCASLGTKDANKVGRKTMQPVTDLKIQSWAASKRLLCVSGDKLFYSLCQQKLIGNVYMCVKTTWEKTEFNKSEQ